MGGLARSLEQDSGTRANSRHDVVAFLSIDEAVWCGHERAIIWWSGVRAGRCALVGIVLDSALDGGNGISRDERHVVVCVNSIALHVRTLAVILSFSPDLDTATDRLQLDVGAHDGLVAVRQGVDRPAYVLFGCGRAGGLLD